MNDEATGIDKYAISKEYDKQLHNQFDNCSTQRLTEVSKLINEA